MYSQKNLLAKINTFFSEKYDRKNAGEKIFRILKDILDIESGSIFYTNEETQTPLYSFKPDTKISRLKPVKRQHTELSQTLSIEGCAFAKIVIYREKPFNSEEISVFKTCSLIIANIMSDIEMYDIMKIQVKALQEGISKINGFNKIIKEQNKKITEADKVKNKFLANVSHELRSPLNSIIGFSDLLLSKVYGSLNEKQTEYISDIQIAGIHLLGMVNEILDISKIEAHAVTLNCKDFDAALCLNEVLNILKPLILKKKLVIENLITPGTYINADYMKIQQIFFNLLSNSIKFTPENGKITTKAKVSKKYITLIVQDNGIGIDPKNHRKIFKKFEQLNSAQYSGTNSTGLGLTITKEIVKLHNGKIKVSGELNKGATFEIQLPVKN